MRQQRETEMLGDRWDSTGHVPRMAGLGQKLDRLLLAGRRHSSDATERPLICALQSSRREGPLWIVEPPFIAADRSTVDDPKRTPRTP